MIGTAALAMLPGPPWFQRLVIKIRLVIGVVVGMALGLMRAPDCCSP
ncbi:hypothetical protein [Mycobacterium ostraviense]|nr:hypothetical protein [Mycobacterium ostraviense]UGT93549.1 hypothetical protein LTS72_10030 [Mycobacterium ostraviense]